MVPARTLANTIARRPNISESHSETRVLEYSFSTPFFRTKGYLRVLRAEERAGSQASCRRGVYRGGPPPAREIAAMRPLWRPTWAPRICFLKTESVFEQNRFSAPRRRKKGALSFYVSKHMGCADTVNLPAKPNTQRMGSEGSRLAESERGCLVLLETVIRKYLHTPFQKGRTSPFFPGTPIVCPPQSWRAQRPTSANTAYARTPNS